MTPNEILDAIPGVHQTSQETGETHYDSLAPIIIEMERALRDLRDACTDAYKIGRIPAEPFVRAGNVLAEVQS